MIKPRSILCALLAISMILLFCACGKEEVEETTFPSTSSDTTNPLGSSTATLIQDTLVVNMEDYKNRPHEIQPGTVINLIAPNDVPSQVPWNCSSDGFILSSVYESLMYMYLGDVHDVRGAIAESWEHSEDFLTWTFKIREGVKFTDGTICDAKALVESWNYHKEAQASDFTSYKIDSWESTDENTFVVHMQAPCAYFEQAMCGGVHVAVSPTALSLYGIDDNRSAVGAGPYYIAEYSSGERIVMKANPDYFLEEKMPCIETVNWQIIKDTNTKLLAMINGDVEAFTTNSLESYYNLKDSDFDGTLIATLGVVGPMWLNAKKVPAFKTLEVRKAMDRFIDFESVNQLVYDGMGVVADSIWAKGSSGYVPSDQYYYNVDEGKELLTSVGMVPSDISFEATIGESGKNSFVAYQNELSKVGVKMEVEIIEAEANFTLLKNGDWSITVGSNAYANSAPYRPWTLILLPDALIKQCWQDVYDPELYQKMLDEHAAMLSSKTWDEMIEHCNQLTTYVQDDFGALAGIQGAAFIAISSEIKNPIYYTNNLSLQLYYLYKQNPYNILPIRQAVTPFDDRAHVQQQDR